MQTMDCSNSKHSYNYKGLVLADSITPTSRVRAIVPVCWPFQHVDWKLTKKH